MANTNSLYAPFPLSPELGGTGVATPAANGVLVSNGADPVSSISLDDGQVLIGSSGNLPEAATITGGDNISVTNGPGSIIFSCPVSPSFTWEHVPPGGASITLQRNHAYTVKDNSSVADFHFPGDAAYGDLYHISAYGIGDQGFVVHVQGGQVLFIPGVFGQQNHVNSIQISDVCSMEIACVDDSIPSGQIFQVIRFTGSMSV